MSRECIVDDDLVNLIKNSIPNDYCKLMCIEEIEEEKQAIKDSYIKGLMIYCIIYNEVYLTEQMHKRQFKKSIFNYQEEIDFIYLYYLEKNNSEDVKLKDKLIKKYEKKRKKIIREIETLNLLNFNRKIIKYYRKEKDKTFKTVMEITNRLSIISDCMKYKILIESLNLESNIKIDRILNWNIYVVKKTNTIADKIWLM